MLKDLYLKPPPPDIFINKKFTTSSFIFYFENFITI